MVYAVQNYKVYFGLYPSSGIYDKKSQRFGDWIILPHPPEDGDRSSLRTVVIFCHIYQTMDKVQNNPYSSVLRTVYPCNSSTVA
jgi:hypothetical protein